MRPVVIAVTACILVALLHPSQAAWGRLSQVAAWLQPAAELRTPPLKEAHVYFDEATGQLSISKGRLGASRGPSPAPTPAASGSFSDPSRHRSNFGQLRVSTHAAYPDLLQMQAAGFLEGYLTAERIFDYAYNMKAWLASQTNDTFKVGDWLFAQDRWVRQQVHAYGGEPAGTGGDPAAAAADPGPGPHGPDPDPSAPFPSYWRTVGLVMAQFDGLMAGYSARLAEWAEQQQGQQGQQEQQEQQVQLQRHQEGHGGTGGSWSSWLASLASRALGQRSGAGGATAARAGSGSGVSKGGGGPPLDRLTKWDFLMLNALGDMDDLMGVVFPDDDDGSDVDDYEGGGGDAEGSTQQAQQRQQQRLRGGRGQGNTDPREVDRSGCAAAAAGGDPSLGAASASASATPGGRGGWHPCLVSEAEAAERDTSFFFRLDKQGQGEEGGAGGEAGGGQRAQVEGEGQEGEGGLRPPVRRRGSWAGLSPGQVRSRIAKSGRCSVLIKVTPSLDDLLVGHVTWWSYASMLRLYKHYDLRLAAVRPGGELVNGRMSFSSYPGQISSADDWYLLGSGLLVTETSLDIYDHTRYAAFSSPASLLSWQRVLAANMAAADGPGWAVVAAAHNSGTYNNQYMVVDLKRFTPGQELRPGLLTVTEIIPGLTMTADATPQLELGYWPSYNVPYFPEVYNATGYRRHADALAALGPAFAAAAEGLSYQLAPRAKILRRDAAGASDLESFRTLLRSNAWRPAAADQQEAAVGSPSGPGPAHDPLASPSPWNALCGRGDLDPEDPDTYGCMDGKATSYRRALALSADAINGPPTDTDRGPGAGALPPFAWADHPRFARTPHRGMLDVFDTQWEEQRP